MKHLLIHLFQNPNDGAFIRVKNINLAIAETCAAQSLEIVLISLRHYRAAVNPDATTHIFPRRIMLPILWTNRHRVARSWNWISAQLAGMLLALLYRPDIIVGETSTSWRLAKAVKRWWPHARLIADLHGATPEELLFHYQPSKRLELSTHEESALERDIVQNAQFITCQSNNMIGHLVSKYPGNKAKFHAFQCSVRSDLFRNDLELRNKNRQLLGLNDETLFVYSGSFDKWQNVRYSLEIFIEYLKCADSTAKLLVMTASPADELREYGYSLGLNERNLTILKVSHEEVAGYLNAADISFLIRDDSVVNRVASPTKLGEYLACGLPIISGEVAGCWPAAKLNPNCFCMVKLNQAAEAANTIAQFLHIWNKELQKSRQAAIDLASSTLSNQNEIIGLKRFINNQIMESGK